MRSGRRVLAAQSIDMPILQQFASFAIVGAVGTGVHYAVLVALVALAGVAPVPSTSVGAVAGALTNYMLNYRITFASRARHALALRRFMIVAAAGMIVNAAIVDAGIRVVHVHYLLAQVAATGVVLLFGYAANRAWTFRKDSCASK
jgi:putative flippase GtrA